MQFSEEDDTRGGKAEDSSIDKYRLGGGKERRKQEWEEATGAFRKEKEETVGEVKMRCPLQVLADHLPAVPI